MTPGAVLGAALIAGTFGFLGALFGVIFRDFVAVPRNELAREERQRKRAAFALFGSYADPLAAAATAVFWRLEEAFYHPGRATYLELPKPVTEFQRYKFESTVYRLAALLGWIRAFRRELSFFSLDDRTRLHRLEEEIRGFGNALAEGKREEVRRAERLGRFWGIELPEDADRVMEASVSMEEAVKTRHKLDDLWRIRERPPEEQATICCTAADALCRSSGVPEVPLEVAAANVPGAVEILGVREAWVFREQQAAIGDVMLEEISAERSGGRVAVRRFEVIGYGPFDLLLRRAEADAPERRWVGLLERMLMGLDLRGGEEWDARIFQLHEALLATARILVAVAEVEERPGSVEEPTVKRAQEIIAVLETSRAAPKQRAGVGSPDEGASKNTKEGAGRRADRKGGWPWRRGN